jgi:hypothetical protein
MVLSIRVFGAGMSMVASTARPPRTTTMNARKMIRRVRLGTGTGLLSALREGSSA